MNRLKQLRLENGYKSQQDLAAVLFVNQTAVSQWERGVTIPNNQTLIKLSKLYGVSIDYLLGNSNERLPQDSGQRKEPPAKSEEPKVPDGYDQLTAANRMIVDRLIADLAKSQSSQ